MSVKETQTMICQEHKKDASELLNFLRELEEQDKEKEFHGFMSGVRFMGNLRSREQYCQNQTTSH